MGKEFTIPCFVLDPSGRQATSIFQSNRHKIGVGFCQNTDCKLRQKAGIAASEQVRIRIGKKGVIKCGFANSS